MASCRISADAGATTVGYRFRDGASLSEKVDPRIEYREQQLRLASPPAGDAVAILTSAERAAYGADGCGIDWQRPERHVADDDGAAIEQIYRGDNCNCQARVRRNAAGQVVALALRSAC